MDTATMLSNFAARLKELRKAKKVSSEQASSDLEISRPTLSAYEQGKSFPDMLILARIADYYDVSVDYLMNRSAEKETGKPVVISNFSDLRLPQRDINTIASLSDGEKAGLSILINSAGFRDTLETITRSHMASLVKFYYETRQKYRDLDSLKKAIMPKDKMTERVFRIEILSFFDELQKLRITYPCDSNQLFCGNYLSNFSKENAAYLETTEIVNKSKLHDLMDKLIKQIYSRELCGSTDTAFNEWDNTIKQAVEAHISELKNNLALLPQESKTEIAEKKYELRFFEAYLDSFFL